MFHTSGYFKGLPCPYFENGLCERPYCHFGHFKAKPAPSTRVGPTGNPTAALSCNANLLSTAGEVHGVSGKSAVSSTFQRLDKVKWYNPTPIPKLLSHAEKERKRAKKTKSAVPEYKPTPIHLLRKSAALKDTKKPTNTNNQPTTEYIPTQQTDEYILTQQTDEYIPTLQTDEYIPTPIIRSKVSLEQKASSEENLVQDCNTSSSFDDTETVKNADIKLQQLNLESNKNASSADSTVFHVENLPSAQDTGISKKDSRVLKQSSISSNVINNTSPDSVETTNVECNIKIEDVEKCRVDVLLIKQEITGMETDSQIKDVVVVEDSSSQDDMKTEVQSISSESEKGCEVEGDMVKDPDVKDEAVTTVREMNKDTSDTEKKTEQEPVREPITEEEKVPVVHQCSCSKPKENSVSSEKKHGKSKKHKKHKKHSSSSSRKHKSKSSKKSYKHKSHKGKKHKHKSTSKKSKHHSSSSSESSSSSSDEDEDGEAKVSLSKKPHNRSSRKHSAEEKQQKKTKHRSTSSSRSSSKGRKKHSSHSKERSSRSEKSHKHSKASKRRHSSSSRSASSSSGHRRHSVKRKKSTESKKVKSEKVKTLTKENGSLAEKSSKQKGSTTCIALNESTNSKHQQNIKVEAAEKRHINIFDALNESKQCKDTITNETSELVSVAKKTELVVHSHLMEDSRTLLNNHLPPTPTASKPHTKPAFQKSMSHIALFGEDSDQEQPVEAMVGDNNRNDSDSDSVILSSDSDLPQLNTTLKDEKMKSPVLSLELDDVDFSDHDPFDECLQIFNEAAQEVKDKPVVKPIKSEQENKDTSFGKKREAHGPLKIKSTTQQRIEAERRTPRPSASQVMHGRLLAAQEHSLAEQEDFLQRKKRKVSQDPFAKKLRVAHVIVKEPEKMQKKKLKCSDGAKKEGREKKKAKRPIIPPDFGNKVPTGVRQQYLNTMIDDCLKIYVKDQDAYDRALKEEKIVYDRSNNRSVYMRVAVNAIKKLRDEISTKTQATSRGVVSHSSVLGGAKAAHTHFTLNRSGTRKPLELTVTLFCEYLEESQLMTESQLEENGYPRTDLERPGHARFEVRDKERLIVTTDKLERNCVRCGKRFHVAPRGNYVKTEECFYHWGKAWKRKLAGSWENKWTCCGGDLSAKGCQVCKAHVHEYNKYTTTSGFVKTLPCSPKPEKDCRVYSLDCEMVYTVEGLELARVTVVDFNCETILEKLVQPNGEVIDHNTRFSGITAADLKGVKTTLRDIQAILLSLFTQRTILMGHSLESDLMALKLIHSNVVDTSLVFPHKLGLPYKRALKTLMAEYLQKIIQEDEGGHDSLEDASSCMQLMIWKAKNDLKYTKLKSMG